MRITIITPVYNGEAFIRETVDSVLALENQIDFEYIVVNDGSTDQTAKILLEFQDRIITLNQENLGEAAAINSAMSEASGDLMLVVSADDPLLSPELFDGVFDKFCEDQDLAAIYPDWQVINQYGVRERIVKVPEYSDEFLIGRCRTLPGPGTIFRSSFAREIGGRDTKWVYVSDYDFWLRLSRKGKILHRPGVYAQWRRHAGSTSITKRGARMAEERINVIQEFLRTNQVPTNIERMALGNSFYMAARLSFFSDEIPGKKYLFAAFKYRRGWVEEGRLHVVAFILLLPFSLQLIKFTRKLIKPTI